MAPWQRKTQKGQKRQVRSLDVISERSQESLDEQSLPNTSLKKEDLLHPISAQSWDSYKHGLNPDRIEADYTPKHLSTAPQDTKKPRPKSLGHDTNPFESLPKILTRALEAESNQSREKDFKPCQTRNVQAERIQLFYDDCILILDDLAELCEDKLEEEESHKKVKIFHDLYKQLQNAVFRLLAWGAQVNIKYLRDTKFHPKETSEKVSVVLMRLTGHLSTMKGLFETATLQDFIEPEELVDDSNSTDKEYSSDEESVSDEDVNENVSIDDIYKTVGSRIQDNLVSVNSKLRELTLLSRPFQYSIRPNTMRHAVASIVTDGHKYFGNTEALEQYPVDESLFGSEALKAAREMEKGQVKGIDRKSLIADRRRSAGDARMSRLIERGPVQQAPILLRTLPEHLDVETLKFFDIEWIEDPADPSYIIVLRELGMSEVDMLFEHTRGLRKQKKETGDSKERDKERGSPIYSFVKKRERNARESWAMKEFSST